MSTHKTTLLIVDDNIYNLMVLSSILDNQGYNVLKAHSGLEAIAIAKSQQPDLILLDIIMPDVNGYEVCCILKNEVTTHRIPIVFISALENPDEKVEAFSVGGVDFINKPFQLVEVLARVETHLRLSSLQFQLMEQAKLLKLQNITLQRELCNISGINPKQYERISEGFVNNEFRVFYQPIINLQSGVINGFEALIRWQHPQKGIISPAEFIEVMEATDLIYSVGRWVINTACQQLRIWQSHYPDCKHLTISVNVSTKQLIEFNLVDYVKGILTKYDIDPQCLKLEITESTVMGDRDITLRNLHQLKELGLNFCIDDFGTGYSSLRRLTDFPIDILKIDYSFIHNAEWLIVKAIATLAFSLGKEVVLEGIETQEQLELLKSFFPNYLSMVYGQGYLFARPLDAFAASVFLEQSYRSN
jgi:EAL domain-containing protein (putative c-di-GMP-specific phosphodiesterase class I)/CheY-like chemotaxis protein